MSATRQHAEDRRARDERALFERVANDGDARARDELVERFLPLAYALALRYRRPYESLDDLVQVASLGLIKAIDRFDPGRRIAFSTFAVPTVLAEIRRHFRDRAWAVQVQELALDAQPAGGSYRALSFDARGMASALGVEEDGFERAEDRATLQALMDLLPPREREILRLRFEEDMTQAEIGAVIGVSQMQVSRIIHSTLERLRVCAEPAFASLSSAPLD
jgi:RNA polymerase sigma-B factor